MDDLPVTRVRSIKECQKDEFWLRDKIYDDPTILGLGNLQAIEKEKQLSNGRLDLLIKNPEDDSMYEVEIQLGPTDESHIIRTLEYWEHQRRRWPRRNHTAVLVAEKITSRFFNIVDLISEAVPIIGIQANIVEIGDSQGLNFTKIIDSYEEPEETETQEPFDEKYWMEQSPDVLNCALWYKQILEKLYGEIPTKYFKGYISFTIAGIARVWVERRMRMNLAVISVKPTEVSFQEIIEYLNTQDFVFNTRQNDLTFKASLTELNENTATHEWLAAHIAPDAVINS